MIEIFDEDNYERKVAESRTPTKRRDLNCFLLLESLLPGTGDIVSGAEHDQIWIGVDVEKLLAVITEDDARDLSALGLIWDDSIESFFMFA